MSKSNSNAKTVAMLSSVSQAVSDIDVAPQGTQDQSAKLILTPSLRVVEPSEKLVEIAEGIKEAVKEAVALSDVSDESIDTNKDTGAEFHHKKPGTKTGADQSSLESTIAELEAEIAEQDGEWEPDGSDFEEDLDAEAILSKPVHNWVNTAKEDVTEIETVADAANAAQQDETKTVNLFADDTSTIDKKILRGMVREILRDELQGEFGERITRCIRKHVRSEINLALAVRDFE